MIVFIFFSAFVVMNSLNFTDFTKITMSKPLMIALEITILAETGLIAYGWYEYLNFGTCSYKDNKKFLSFLGLLVTCSCFNAFFLVFAGYVFIDGHPLIKKVFKLKPTRGSNSKFVYFKIFLILALYLIPDINYYTSDSSQNYK